MDVIPVSYTHLIASDDQSEYAANAEQYHYGCQCIYKYGYPKYSTDNSYFADGWCYAFRRPETGRAKQ